MSRRPAPLIDIVRMEDKETKLKAFIRTVVEQAATVEAGADQSILLIARSVESPVAKAVAALVKEGAILGPVKSIIAIIPRSDADQSVCEALNALVGHHGARVIRDSRLFDAHEQIVLGPASSWVGDCMRRDPMKRDAYECYAADCVKTAGWARTSHNRLWDICEVMPEIVFAPSAPAEVVEAAAAAAADIDPNSDPLAGN
jgi:hypothetical protein